MLSHAVIRDRIEAALRKAGIPRSRVSWSRGGRILEILGASGIERIDVGARVPQYKLDQIITRITLVGTGLRASETRRHNTET